MSTAGKNIVSIGMICSKLENLSKINERNALWISQRSYLKSCSIQGYLLLTKLKILYVFYIVYLTIILLFAQL